MLYNTIVFITASVALFLYLPLIALAAQGKSCVSSAPKSWTQEQKHSFCEATSPSGWNGPIECALQARSDLKLKFDDVYLLCVDSSNLFPVMCMNSLSKKERELYGVSLCTRAVSDATANCWHDLGQYKGKHKISDTSEIINFCRELDGIGPQYCVRTAHQVVGITPAAAMSTCANALVTIDTDTMKSCLTHLKPHIYSTSSHIPTREHGKKGVADVEAIDFCAGALNEHSVSCFLASSDLKLSASDRLKLCYGSDAESGPVECFNELLFDSKKIATSGHDSSKSLIGDRIALGVSLCAMAVGKGPAVCFNEGLKISSGEIVPSESILSSRSAGQKNRDKSTGAVELSDTDHTLLQLCQGSTNSGPIDCFRKSHSVFRPVDLSSDSSIAWYRSMYGTVDGGFGRGLGLEMKIHLCLHAPSSSPAECGLKAPHVSTMT